MQCRFWLIGCALIAALALQAKPKVKQVMTQEQEQQFLYYFYAARHAIEQENYARAFILLDFCYQINPDDALVNDHLGVIYSSLKQDQKAGEYFAKAYKLAPAECSEHYLNYLINAQQWKKALKVQNHIDELQGFDSNSALNRYRIYLGLNKGKNAVAAIDRYLEQDPNSLNFLLFRADIHIRLQEEKPVFELAQRISKLFPLTLQELEMIKKVPYCAYIVSHIKTYQADSLMTMDQRDRAYENYEVAIYLWPKNLTALNNFAYSLATHNGNLSQAEQMSSTTIQADANNPVFLDTYAWILHLKGQDVLAAFYLRKALENAKDEEVKKVVLEHLEQIKQ